MEAITNLSISSPHLSPVKSGRLQPLLPALLVNHQGIDFYIGNVFAVDDYISIRIYGFNQGVYSRASSPLTPSRRA